MNIIITGPKHCGKTTVISKIIDGFSGNISGFITEFDNRESDSRKLNLRDVNGSSLYCAVKWTQGVIEVFPDVFNSFASKLIDPKSELIIIDELGKFEVDCLRLKDAVISAFSSPGNTLVAVRLDAAGWMQELKSRPDTTVINVSENNRDSLPEQILALLTNNGKPL